MQARSQFAGLTLAGIMLLALTSWAAPEESPPLADPSSVARAVEVAPHSAPLSVAVLPFDSKDKSLGAQVAEIIAARLSEDPALQLVERDHLDAILNEQKLSLSAAVHPAEAARVGWLAGAQVIIVGRAYPVDEQILVTARTIGVETSRVYVSQARASVSDPLLPVLDRLAASVHENVTRRRSQLLAPDTSTEKEKLLERLAERLKGRQLPELVVAVSEVHYGAPATDPAAETELALWLKECAFTVYDPGQLERRLRDWAREYYPADEQAILRILPESVTVVLVGQAFSEAGGRFGDLISAKGRVEVRALDRATGSIIAIARRTTAAVDLSERIAAKKAVQDAAASIAYEIIPKVAAYKPAR